MDGAKVGVLMHYELASPLTNGFLCSTSLSPVYLPKPDSRFCNRCQFSGPSFGCVIGQQAFSSVTLMEAWTRP